MPLYDYECPACGPFREWRPMAEAGESTPCPCCGHPGERRLGATGLPRLARNTRIAHERNERAAHEPRVEYRAAGKGEAERHHHPAERHPARRWMVGH